MLSVYPNYYFIGSLISFLFTVYIAMMLFRIKDKSPASFHLGLTMVFMALFNLSYALTHGLYPLPHFFPRWFNIITALWGATHSALFFWHFPASRNPQLSRKLLISLHLIILLLCSYLFFEMSQAPIFYAFNAHFWDSDSMPIQKIFGIIILIFFSHLILTGIWRGFVEKGIERLVVFLLAAAFLTVTMVPGVFNAMSRDNLIQRSTYQTAVVIFNLVGFFATIVLYLNITRDRSRILSRIIAISLVSLLLIYQGIAFFWLKSIEKSSDEHFYQLALQSHAEHKTAQGANPPNCIRFSI